MAKKKRPSGGIVNKRARFDYELGDSLVLGLVLTGAETKALRLGHGQLTGAYVAVKGGELWLINAQIMGSPAVPLTQDQQTRSRKLLAKKPEIEHLMDQKQRGLTIIPLELLTKGHYIKLRVAAGKGKKRYDKRETLKRRQQERDIRRTLKGR